MRRRIKTMNKTKYSALLILILLATAMFSVALVAAQDQPIEQIPIEQFPSVPNPNTTPSPPATAETANIVVASSLGGSTSPVPGAYVYAYGATIELQATANSGYKFLYWSIRGSYTPGHNQPPINYPELAANDPEFVPSFPSMAQVSEDSLITSTNPLKIICGYGYTYVYQPVFVPTTPTTPTSDAIVTVVDSIGGTTNPGSGTYHYANGTTIHLEATPSSDYNFQYWVAVGEDGHATTISDNPTNIICGYGYTYSYQPMFAPKGTNTTSTSTNEMYFYVIIAVLAIVAVVGLVMAVMYRGKAKK
jgi:Divergent InlB B-repeat domain